MPVNENTSNFLNQETDQESSFLTTDFASVETPVESIKNLEKSAYFNVAPDEYVTAKKDLDIAYDAMKRTPAEVHPSVVKIQAKSKEHANATKEDTGVLSAIGDIFDHVKYNVSGRDDLDKKINSLTDLGFADELNEEGNVELDRLLAERQKIESKFEGMSFTEQLPGNVGKAIDDMLGSIKDNSGKIALATGAGAAFGALGGTVSLPIIGTGVGALGVGGVALGNATLAAMTSNAYNQTVNDTWLMLRAGIKDDNGNKIELTKDQMQNISRAVGASAGIFELTGGKILGSTIAKVAKRKTILELIKRSGSREALINLGKQSAVSATSSGVEEVLAEIASVGGEVYAKNINEDVGKMFSDFTSTSTNPETIKRFYQTFTVGAVTGATVTGSAGLVSLRSQARSVDENNARIKELAKKFEVEPKQLAETIKSYEKQQSNFKKVNDIIIAKESINAVIKMQDETLLNQTSPEQAKSITSEIIKEAGLTDFHLTESDLSIIKENNPELHAQLLQFDETRSVTDNTSSGVIIEAAPLIDLVRDHPALADYIRDNPLGPNPLEASNYVDRINSAEPRRRALLEKLGVNGELNVEDQAMLDELNQEINEPTYRKGQEGYLEGVESFTKNVKESLTDKQVEIYEKSQKNIRGNVNDLIEQAFQIEEENKIKRVLKSNRKIELENQRLADAEEIGITNRFIKKKGRKDIAIDPKYLPEDLREVYTNDPVLKKRKVFKKGGLTPEESAFLAGVDDWEKMLKIVANSKTVQERAALISKKIAELESQVQDVRLVNIEKRLDSKFDDYNKLRHMEMDFIGKNDRTTLKRGTKYVALPLSGLTANMNQRASSIINKTKIGKLQVTQYSKARNINQAKSMNHIFKNEVNEAFQAKEKAVLNNELIRESYKAKREISKSKTYIKNILLNSKNVSNLKKSGMWKYADDILSLYNLEGGTKNALRQENYNNFVKEMLTEGVEFTIPERLNDIRERGDNLTVEQFIAITDQLKMINHQSKLKNKLLKKRELNNKELKTEELNRVAKDLVTDLEKNSNYDETRSQETRLRGLSDSKKEAISKFLKAGLGANTNIRNILLKADDENISGRNAEAVQHPISEREIVQSKMNSDIKKQMEMIAQDYGIEDYKKAFYEQIEVPEFANYPGLSKNGKTTKTHLWRLLMYKGDPDALNTMTNFLDKQGNNISMDTIDQVLENYLTVKDGKLVQNFTNIFKSFEEESFALHERTTGVKPTRIKAIPIVHKGVVLEGGYAAISRLSEAIDVKNKKASDSLTNTMPGEPDNSFYGRKRAEEQTEQGRFEERQKGSKLELDLDFNKVIKAYDEHVHDIAYREVGLDTLKLLRHPDYKKALINTVGKTSYDSLVESVIEKVGKDTSPSIDSETVGILRNAYNNVMKGVYNGLLGSNWSSIAMQPLAFKNIILRMDKGGAKHLTATIAKSLQLLVKGGKKEYGEIFNRGMEIDPSISDSLMKVEESVHGTVRELIDNKKPTKFTEMKKYVEEINFFGLSHVDLHVKVIAANAAYNQYVNGDVKGVNVEYLNTLTDEQIDKKAKEYARSINKLASTTIKKIDKATIEKLEAMQVFTMFFTDIRQTINTEVSQYRKIKKGVKQNNYKDASYAAISLLVMNTLSDMYTSSIYGTEGPLDELLSAEDTGDLMTSAGALVINSTTAGIKNVPLIREIDYANRSNRKIKTVRTIPGKIGSDIATTWAAINTLTSLESLNSKQIESMLYSYNYATGGVIPVNALRKTLDALEMDFTDMTDAPSLLLGSVLSKVVKTGKNSKNPTIVKASEDLEKQIPSDAKDIEIPEDALISLASKDNDFLNPETGAAGKYQFTQDQWDRIAEKHEYLNLTDEGRTDIEDTQEQDRAMYQNMEDSAKVLTDYDLPVNNENLQGSHLFGAENYALLLLSDNKSKLPEELTKQEIFKDFKTVKAVKDYVAKQVKTNKQIDN